MNSLNLTTSLTNYPLTIEGLRLLQDAITLASCGALTGGSSDGCYIVSGCTTSDKVVSPGTLLIAGELYSISKEYTVATYIQITPVYEDVTVGETTYNDARLIKTISFTDSPSGNYHKWADFVRITTNADLASLISNNGINYKNTSNYLVPKGGIIMWSGNIDDIPYGWGLCDGNTHYGVKTPDLKGKFIQGYAIGVNSIGDTGGTDTTYDVISHVHSYVGDDSIWSSGLTGQGYSKSDLSVNNGAVGGYDMTSTSRYNTFYFYPSSTPLRITSGSVKGSLENRPSFYVLAYIMKIQ